MEIIAAEPSEPRLQATARALDAIAAKVSRRQMSFSRRLGALAAIGGLAAAWHYHVAGLTLSHYDAKAHLVVARRVIDSLTPGWQQVGAVWLPLPHLLNLLPVQIDALYRSGAAAVLISVASFAVACAAAAYIVLGATGSRLAAAITVALMALNPNLLYLQSTPMTEPLLLALELTGVASLLAWVSSAGHSSPRGPGIVLALACLTRYEAWPVTAVAIVAAGFALRAQGVRRRTALAEMAGVAVYPLVAIAWFALHSRVTIGRWFMDNSFFVAENLAMGHPLQSAAQVWWGVHRLSGIGLTIVAALAIVALLTVALTRRRYSSVLLTLAPLAAAALPWYAFVEGHPFRVRYMVPVVAASAIVTGVAIGLLRPRARLVGAALVALTALVELQPMDARAPMVVEAQWDIPHSEGRRAVTACLARDYRGEKILASMGSLAHYMQETSAAGFALRDYVHEGNGKIWTSAVEQPRIFVGWILVEERAEGGDMLAARGRQDPAFFSGFSRVCEGGGIALYRRSPGSETAQNFR